MRILFDSKQLQHKAPFGTLVPGQECRLCIHIPVSVHTVRVECLLESVDGHTLYAPLSLQQTVGDYEYWGGSFKFDRVGLYYYYFLITTPTHTFRLFKYGDDTNMEDGARWQVSCIPADFTTPDWAKGATIYQIFPDRFYKKGSCDLSSKLQPYTLHENWDEEVHWQPTAEGEVLNNDFYGGNFAGITEKLPYLASLGVTLLYLNPISKSFSSHRYDTGNYKQPDPMLGTEADFSALCNAAHSLGMKVILDGVFSHTGSDSLYFDKNRTFGGSGAYCTKDSPYYSWYNFQNWPDQYSSWWGFKTLPTVNKMDPAFIEYIITGPDSVIAHWLNAGCDGFRLDVADELPCAFLSLLKSHMRKLRPDALLLGEVWEDASNKVAYDRHRRYFIDGQLDSVMNYPFRNAILQFVRQHDDGFNLKQTVMNIAENYPPQVLACNMNLLGSHDSARILTALVDDFDGSREALAQRFLSPEQRQLALQRLALASFLQYTLPGSPSIYYGDEAGMEGGKDPFNRRTYPWGKENAALQNHYRALGQLRRENEALRLGDIHFLHAQNGQLQFVRRYEGKQLRITVNNSTAPWRIGPGKLLFARGCSCDESGLLLQSMGYCITEG